jgi:hypothetical protein
MDVIAHETSEQLWRALGDAVVRIWGRLPPDLQNRLPINRGHTEVSVISSWQRWCRRQAQ